MCSFEETNNYMKPTVQIPDSERERIIIKLNDSLAAYQVFYQNLRGFHWNIKGENFFELHVQFENWYNDAALQIDALAERILTLGGEPLHSFKEYLETSSIEPKTKKYNGREIMEMIYHDHISLLHLLGQAVEVAGQSDDEGTNDLLTPMISNLEKTNWMVGAWLKS